MTRGAVGSVSNGVFVDSALVHLLCTVSTAVSSAR